MKKKKIAIKPFLNTYLEPVGSEIVKNKKKDIYSLYYKITYNRKNTQLKSHYGFAFSDLEDSSVKEIIDFETKILTRIIEYETSLHADREYQLSGLKQKYEIYVLSVFQVMDSYLREKLIKASARTKHPWHQAVDFHASGAVLNVLELLEMCKTLFKNFDQYVDKIFLTELECFRVYIDVFPIPLFRYDFATLIDWKNGSHRIALSTALRISSKNNFQIKKLIQNIDDMLKNCYNVISE